MTRNREVISIKNPRKGIFYALLHTLDAFRTVDWRNIGFEIEILGFI